MSKNKKIIAIIPAREKSKDLSMKKHIVRLIDFYEQVVENKREGD